jgi:hypothetical protein
MRENDGAPKVTKASEQRPTRTDLNGENEVLDPDQQPPDEPSTGRREASHERSPASSPNKV